jgi:hypothetical protein
MRNSVQDSFFQSRPETLVGIIKPSQARAPINAPSEELVTPTEFIMKPKTKKVMTLGDSKTPSY